MTAEIKWNDFLKFTIL